MSADAEPNPERLTAGSATILWIIATADAPLTPSEIADELDAEKSSTSSTLLRLYRAGLVLRRKRPGTRAGQGRSPYEYTLAPRGETE